MRGAGAGDPRRSGERRWTVLFIGDHGKVIPFKRVKTVAILVAAAMATAVAAVAVLAWVNHGLHARGRDQLQRLESARTENEQLRRERELLTAQVVVLESRMRETASGPAAPSERRATPEPPPVEAAQTPEPPAADPPPVFRPPVDPGEGVAVEGFRLTPRADGLMELRYKLTALAQPRTPLAGHVIVVLSAEDIEPERWLSLPRVELVRGRPTGRQKGYTFAISHNKEFVQSVAAPRPMAAFTRAVLYVFSSDGRLLLARDYSVRFLPG
ncbi:MAG TPA: hypothetical protein VLH81_05825 [Desulfobacterales bacterium]|nr:hypothetical protein [Desulfobacterales bacterium]